MGEAVAHVTRRHSHPRAVEDPTPPPEPTGIDYLGLVTARHHEALGQQIPYGELPDDPAVISSVPAVWDLALDRPIEDEMREEER